MKQFQVFKESLTFFKKHSFEIFDYKDINQFYQRFKKEVEHRYRENIEDFEDEVFKTLFFQYLGFNTSYGLGYDFTTPICKQVWTFSPYVEDEYSNQVQFINNHLERVLGCQIPVSEINYQISDYKCAVNFSFKNIKITLEEENLTLMSHDYIFKIKELIYGDKLLGNIYILDFGWEDSVLFSCSKNILNELISFLGVDENRIK